MRKRIIAAVISIVIIIGICTGCAPHSSSIAPSPAITESAPVTGSPADSAGVDGKNDKPVSLIQAKPYLVVEEGNLVNDSAA